MRGWMVDTISADDPATVEVDALFCRYRSYDNIFAFADDWVRVWTCRSLREESAGAASTRPSLGFLQLTTSHGSRVLDLRK